MRFDFVLHELIGPLKGVLQIRMKPSSWSDLWYQSKVKVISEVENLKINDH